MIPIAKPLFDEAEKQAVLAVLDSGQVAQGRAVEDLERRFARWCGVEHAVAVSSGTAALIVALMAHGVGPGDEVVTTPFSFIATANAILAVGARPVFADVRPEDCNIDPAAVERALTPRTKAVMPVHLYGQVADMDALEPLARRHGLALIEDACQAHGAALGGRRAGSFGTGCFSFYPTKNMTTAEGGIITTDDPEVAERARMIRNHGSRQRYYHEILGFNYRMTDLAAAIGVAQMEKIDAFNARRRANAAYLNQRLTGLPGVTTPVERPGATHVYHQYTVRVHGHRDRFAARLAELGVGSAVHYPLPIHHQPLYRDLGYDGSYPQAETASREVLSLPVHPGLTDDELARVADAVRQTACELAAQPVSEERGA